MAKTKGRKGGFGDSSLALVKGDRRVVYVSFPLAELTRYREEARARGVPVGEYIASLLPKRPRRAAPAKKKR